MTSVLISGASIAGPALAFWLRRAGVDVTVVEKAETSAAAATRSTCAAWRSTSSSGWACSTGSRRPAPGHVC